MAQVHRTRIEKHQREKAPYSVDFADDDALADGDTLTGAPTVTVTLDGVDKSGEFGASSIQIQTTKVAFTLAKATGGGQVAGTYVCLVEVDTENGAHLVSENELVVVATGVPA